MKNASINKVDKDALNDKKSAFSNASDDSIVNFMNEDKNLSDPDVDRNESCKCSTSKQGRKWLIGGPAEETFFTF